MKEGNTSCGKMGRGRERSKVKSGNVIACGDCLKFHFWNTRLNSRNGISSDLVVIPVNVSLETFSSLTKQTSFWPSFDPVSFFQLSCHLAPRDPLKKQTTTTTTTTSLELGVVIPRCSGRRSKFATRKEGKTELAAQNPIFAL